MAVTELWRPLLAIAIGALLFGVLAAVVAVHLGWAYGP